MRRLALCLAALALAACGTDDSPEAADEGTVVRTGDTVEGTLSPGDSVFTTDGSFYDLYAFQGEPLEPLEITLASADFDAYLAGGATREDALRGVDDDDDGAGGTDARLLVRADTRGRYVIRANSLRGGESGAYTLTVQRAGATMSDGMMATSASGGGLALGRTVSGRLDDSDERFNGLFADGYVIEASAGERLVATLASDDPIGIVVLASDENGEPVVIAENFDAGIGDTRVRFTSRGGEHIVAAVALNDRGVERYTLLVDRAASMRDVDRRRFPGQWVAAGYGRTRDYADVREVVQQERWLEQTARSLSEAYPLPADMPISFEECGEPNARYDASEPEIVYCYELVAVFAQILAEDFSGERLAQAIRGSYDSVMLHEAGHAMIDQLGLPITGREEDAADQFAALHLIGEGFEGAWAAVDGVRGLQDNSGVVTVGELAGVHSLGAQRLFNTLCLVYGSDPDAYRELVPGDLPEERALTCPSEFAQVDKAFDRLLMLAYDG